MGQAPRTESNEGEADATGMGLLNPKKRSQRAARCCAVLRASLPVAVTSSEGGDTCLLCRNSWSMRSWARLTRRCRVP